MKKYLLIVLIAYCNILISQHQSCDGTRYIDDLFTEITVTKGVKYGENETWLGTFQELYLDVYEPKGDMLEKRPTIIMAFGGSFIAGERENLAAICESYAKKGYVAVTIDYRLFDGPIFPVPSASIMKDVVVKAIGDYRAAIRFMKEDAATTNTFRVDANYIMVGGISAGAIAASHAAVLDESDPIPDDLLEIISDNGGLEGNTSSNTEYSSEVIAIVNFSGALNNATLISEFDPPLFSVHDDQDPTVPYDNGFVTIFGFPIAPLDGSARMHEVCDSIGIQNELITIENSTGHVSYFDGDSLAGVMMINRSSVFMENVVCNELISDIKVVDIMSEVDVFPNPSTGIVTVESKDHINKIQVFNLSGQKIMQLKGTLNFNVSNFDQGIYILKVYGHEDALLSTHKLILQK